MKTLVYEPYITGHHVEHLNLMYLRAGEKTDQEFVFIVDPSLRSQATELKWPEFRNIKIHFLDTAEISGIECGALKSAFRQTLLVRKYAGKYGAEKIFVISLMSLMPFLALLPARYAVSGIIYIIYLRSYKAASVSRRILDISKYLVFSKSKIFEKIYLMNDFASPAVLNKKFGCDKFRYLPDPVSRVVSHGTINIRQEHKIPSEIKVFLHFGMLTERKGTLDILKAIELMDQKIQSRSCLIFAGIIEKDISESFRKYIKDLSSKMRIMVFEGYSTYDLIESLCASADYILVPYQRCSQSSGLLGYAARFNVPVIGNSKGLLRSLIIKFKLGTVCNTENIAEFSSCMEKAILNPKIRIDGSRYLELNSPERFKNVIFE